MQYPSRRPLNRRQARIIIMLLILAAATHLCSYQLAHGQSREVSDAVSSEKFIISPERFNRGVTIEFREESTVVGNEIRLRQIARWSDADKEILDPIGDLIVARLDNKTAFRKVSMAEVKSMLGDAGINISTIHFVGRMFCTVNRSDVQFAEGAALRQWSNLKDSPATQPTSAIQEPARPDVIVAEDAGKSLKQLLAENLAQKLGLSIDVLQLTFRSQDDRVLRLVEPHFKFTIEPQHTGNLGDVSWNVQINTATGKERVFVQAYACAWQDQILVSKPLTTRQTITEADIECRRTLADKLPDDVLLRKEQIVGQAAARDLKPGMFYTARTVDPVQLVKQGQFVTIQLANGGVRIKSVAKALDSGTLGQSIRVKNETTRDVYRVTVTGAQEASVDAVGVASATE